MRVLLTGCTRIMAGDKLGRNTSYVSFAPLLKQLLEMIPDVEVVQTAVMPGDYAMIEEYDLALVGMAAVNGFSGKKHRWSAMWVMSQLPHLVYVDDWQVGSLVSSLRRAKETWKTALLTKDELEERELGLLVKEEIERVRYELHYGFTTGESGTVLAPLFGWGDRDKFKELALPCRRLFTLDPSRLVPVLGVAKEQARAWAYAGLKDHSRFLDRIDPPLSWPIHTIMPQQGKRGGWGRVTEQEVVTNLYAPNWGNIVVPYSRKMRGTGWWRSRYNFASQVGNVLWVSQDDLGFLDRYKFPSFKEIEALNADQLRQLEAEQHFEMQHFHPQAKTLQRELASYLQHPEEPIR